MDNQTVWARVCLSVYGALPRLTASLEKCVNAAAMSGFSYTGDTYALMERIIAMNARKAALINLKVVTDKALARLKPAYRKVLEMKADKLRFARIAELEDVCIRTVFRRYERGMESFAGALAKIGCDENWFESRYGADELIGRLKERESARLRKLADAEQEAQTEEKIAACRTAGAPRLSVSL